MTEPDHKVKPEDIPKSSSGWKIASYISFVVIVGLIVLNVLPRNGKKEILDKSIAVLPLKYLSENPDKEYLANGVLDAITGHLSTIEGLRVMPRTSVEQYRENKKSAKEIGEELGVSYLIEGSFLMVGDQVKLTIQLVVAEKGDHLFFKEYDRDYKDIFAVQSEIAQTIAEEIQVAITPEEKALIEKVPTTDLTAYDFYIKANNYLQYYSDTRNLDSYQKAVSLYIASLEMDPEFARAYTGLAFAYWNRYYWESYFRENFLDSCLILADKALSFDNRLDEAYYIKGQYYFQNGQIEESLIQYDSALKYNPNYYLAYNAKGWILCAVLNDFIKGLDSYHKALNLIHGNDRPSLLRTLGVIYSHMGFKDKAIQFNQEALELDGDSVSTLTLMCSMEYYYGDAEKALKLARKVNDMDSTSSMEIYIYSTPPGHEEEAYEYANKYLEYMKRTGALNLSQSHRIGYAYWQVGRYEEAKNFFNEQIKYGTESIIRSRSLASILSAQYDLAGVYAFMGEKEKAYQLLEEFEKRQSFNWYLLLRKDPMFNSLRQEERFQRILQNIEVHIQAEHERIRQWLEENDMI